FPKMLDEALAKRRDELHNVKVRGNLTMGPIQVIECDPTMEHFVYNTWHCSGYERKMCDQGRAFFTPMVFRNIPWYYKNFVTVNVAMISVTPMDKHGYFNLSGAAGVSRAIIEKADRVIVEVNEALPRVRGGEGELVHISEVDYVVEAGYIEPFSPPMLPPTREDIKIAEFILPHVLDGTTIQLGIGGTPNALGTLIAESDLKDLGMHTELCSDGFMAMAKAGKL
ncbi:acetyl-CoA hydrolase/transferase, partial [gut metagenome]